MTPSDATHLAHTGETEHQRDLVVTAREVAADDVVSLTLADPSGAELPVWEPGAHIDVLIGEEWVRQYSLCGSPADRSSWRIGVLLEPGGRGGSAAAHALAVGDQVGTRGPRNHFPLAAAPRYVFVAGGIGVTPIRPMLDAAEAAGTQWELWYGGRARTSMAFLYELTALGGDRVTVWPQDENGLLPLDRILGSLDPGTLVYCCGPEPLLEAVEAHCPSGSLRVERFTAKPIEVPVGGDTAFEVVCRQSDVTVTVPAEMSIIDAVEAHGVTVLSSCQEGVCGTCETRVIEGIPEHRDSLLTDEERAENEYMMICVGRAKTPRLVLDL